MTRQKTILVTFAGRRDRMRLLTRYAGAAIEAGLIDEWHVWDFTRAIEDALWLREEFPVVQTTPSHTTEYFRRPQALEVGAEGLRFPLQVRAPSDVHIGLRRVGGEGPSYEMVLGGWGNAISALRRFEDPAHLAGLALRDREAEPLQIVATPRILPEFRFAQVEIAMGPGGLSAFVDGVPALHHAAAIEPGAFELFYRTGYGSNGDWRWPGMEQARARLFVSGPETHFEPDVKFYTRAYQHYGANRDLYANDVLLKCDDDIVYFDLHRLAEFIAFRKAHPQYFLVSANVVNNGVCAHLQQQAGAIPVSEMTCELPPAGVCGSIWSDGEKATALHRLFLRDPAAFRSGEAAPRIWNQRISINFIALLGADLVHVPDVMFDDEHDLCYGVRKRARKDNCVHQGFVAAHLSFWKQDAAMEVEALLARYEELAQEALASFAAPGRAPAPALRIAADLAA